MGNSGQELRTYSVEMLAGSVVAVQGAQDTERTKTTVQGPEGGRINYLYFA